MTEKYREYEAKIFSMFLSDECNIWPELKTWDYKTIYAISPEKFNSKAFASKELALYGPEALFKRAAMFCAPREELVRIMKFILIIIDYKRYYLDVDKAKADLGINELRNKYFHMVQIDKDE